MIFELLAKNRERFALRECIYFNGRSWTYEKLYDLTNRYTRYFASLHQSRVGLHLSDSAEVMAMLVALDCLGVDVFLFHREYPIERVKQLLTELDVGVCITDVKSAKDPRFRHVKNEGFAIDPTPLSSHASQGKIAFFTSGTTGTPKIVVHTWKSLLGPIREGARFAGSRWLLLYNLTRIGGIQVFLQAFRNGGQLTIPQDYSVGRIVDDLKGKMITHVSATPTFWWKLLLETTPVQRRELSLTQITLGGEAASQPLLNALRGSFPAARITHTYASTEAGFCFAASDCMEGYPIEVVKHNQRDVRIRIVEDELWVRSPHAMQGYVRGGTVQNGWIPMGDLVALRDRRLIFLGRKEQRLSVAGNTVYPADVEREIRRVSGVRDVWVWGAKSSIVGEVVKASVVRSDGRPMEELRREILEHCRKNLSRYEVPRLLEFVDEIPMAANGKAIRCDA